VNLAGQKRHGPSFAPSTLSDFAISRKLPKADVPVTFSNGGSFPADNRPAHATFYPDG
jgi:hypothetical protein